MNSHEVFIHIHQGCFAGTGAIVRLPQCQWSKPDGCGKISQCMTTTKHSKAKTVCIFLGIYCTQMCYATFDILSAASIFCVRTRLMKNIIHNIDSIKIPWLLLLEIFVSLTCEDKQWYFSKLHYNFYRRPSNVSYSMSSTQCSGYRQLGSRFILVQTIRHMVTL